ncbi:MAG: 2-oxoacid:acceptor oxidoreductase family protein, partial [Gammaproteobacteria bacterium]|nr:2-oxoacid:acceptor oxidoreductase family protein [Gammaproteobacteria bacterium]
MRNHAGRNNSVSIAFVGKGGAGVVTAGEILLIAAARAGRYGLMIPAVGPQIRGGESAALLRLGSSPLHCLDDRIDVLAGISWQHVESFKADIPLDSASLIVTDPAAGSLPDFIIAAEPQTCELAMTTIAESVAGGRENMVMLGYVARLAGIPEAALREASEKKLGRKGREAVRAGNECMRLGYAEAASATAAEPVTTSSKERRWLMSGNHATGLGALRGGIRFAAAYPITPATEVLEWLAPRISRAGGTLVQAEDELASINMVIGASFAGIP